MHWHGLHFKTIIALPLMWPDLPVCCEVDLLPIVVVQAAMLEQIVARAKPHGRAEGRMLRSNRHGHASGVAGRGDLGGGVDGEGAWGGGRKSLLCVYNAPGQRYDLMLLLHQAALAYGLLLAPVSCML